MIESIMKFNSMVCHEKLNDSAAKHATTKSNEKMKSIYVDYLNVSMIFFFFLCLTTKLNGNGWQCIDWSRLREPEMKPFQFLLPHRIHLILNYCRSVEILYHRRQRWQFGWIERKMFQTYKSNHLNWLKVKPVFPCL